jgi:putative transposase
MEFGKIYTSDMSDSQWTIVKEILKEENYRCVEEKREQINAVLYLVKTGCQWRNLPIDFPKWKTVYSFYRRACLNGTWLKIQKALVEKVRIRAGKKAEPSYALIDSQSAKAASANEGTGYDGGKNERQKTTHCNRYNGESALCSCTQSQCS